ncbi:MAG: FtsX-like permease family protein [Bacteroidales bacterium]
MLAFRFALRYLFSKKSHNAINIISIICVCGVAITSMALISTMSVFNGFQDLVSSLYSSFDPQVKITSTKGKTFDPTDALFLPIRNHPDIAILTEAIEDNALLSYNERQVTGRIKGVSENFRELTKIDSILLSGEFILKDSIVSYASVGVGLASQLGINTGFVRPITIYAPKRGAKVNLSNPTTAFNEDYLFIASLFSINQPQYDDQMIITSIDFARKVFEYPTEVTSLEIKLKEGVNANRFIQETQKKLGDRYRVLSQYEQQADSYRMMQIEKWVTFLVLSFILLIAAFNIIGSLSMLILEKKEDMTTLRNLGADRSLIMQIFLVEGWLISATGAISGILVGIFLCWIQQTFGIIKLGTSGMFIVDAYPVKVELIDVIAVTLVVSVIGFITAWIPVRQLKKIA